MGPLKDELFSSVWTHLQSMPKCQTLLTALNHPISGSQTIRNAWAALKDNGTNEGINTATGLQSALAARPDIFYFETTDRGHQLIGLTYGARALSPASGIPESVPHVAEPPPETDTNPSVAQLQALVEAEDSGMLANFTTAIMERPSKSLRLAKGKGKGIVSEGPNSCEWGGHWNGRVYVDIVWTPELARKKTEERQKEMKLVRALYRALDMHKGDSVSLSQLGSDFKVSELKKDPHFKNWRLLDILKEYENVFEILPLAGGICVKLQPGAEAALPDAEAAAEHVNEAELMLPERIENPRSTKERIQALRIELLYAVQRRGGRSAIQELGQEAGVQKVKNEIRGVRKLVDWVRIFSDNFKVLPEKSDGHMVVEIASMDVSDQSMIDKALRRDEEDRKPPPPSNRSGGGRGGSDRDRDSFRDRDRGRPQGRSGGSSSSRSSHHLSPYASAAYAGYGYAMPSLGYGPPPGYAQAPLPGSPYGGYPGAPPPAGYPGAPPPAGYPGAPPPAGYPGSQPAGYPGSQPAGYPGAQPSSYPPAQPSGYPGAQPSGQPSGYPPAQSAGYPAPAQGGCCYAPPPQAGYPPPSGGGYPPSSSYPPSGGGYPPSGGSYPPSGGSYPPPSSGYPPPSSGYPPPSSGYPPPSSGYPPPSSGYPPPSSGYPPPAQGGGYPPAGPPANGYPPPQGYHQAPPPGSYPYPVA